MGKVHELKTWPKYYEQVSLGNKTFELRKNDRGFEVGDTLVLKEYDLSTDLYTGRSLNFVASYILHLSDYFQNDNSHVIIGLKRMGL